MSERPIASATKTPSWTELNELTSSSLGGEVNHILLSFVLCPCLLLVFIVIILFPGWRGETSYWLCLWLFFLSLYMGLSFSFFLVYMYALLRFFLRQTTGLLQLNVFYNPPLLSGKRALLSKVSIIIKIIIIKAIIIIIITKITSLISPPSSSNGWSLVRKSSFS